MLRVLRHQRYRRLFTAQVVALLGTGLLTVALGLLAYRLEPDSAGTVVATTLTIKMVVYVVGSPAMTALTARLSPRAVLVSADLVRLGAAATLPWVTDPVQAYALMAVLHLASATFTPTFQALIPEVLPDEDEYTEALSLSRLAYDLEAIASPALAGLLLLVVDASALFLGTAVGFAGSAALVLVALRTPVPPRGSDGGFWARATSGLRVVGRTAALRALLAIDLTVACTTALVLVASTVVVHDDLAGGDVGLAATLAAFGVGSMAVALVLPKLARRIEVRTVLLTGAATSPVTLLLAGAAVATGSWTAVLIAWAALGAATSAAMTLGGRVVADAVEPDVRPAVFAARFSTAHACFLVTYPLTGALLAAGSAAVAATVLALPAAVAGLAAVRLWRVEEPVAS